MLLLLRRGEASLRAGVDRKKANKRLKPGQRAEPVQLRLALQPQGFLGAGFGAKEQEGAGGYNLIAEGGFGFWFPHSSYLRVQRRETGHLRLRKLRRIHASFEFAGRSQKRRQTDAARNLVECTVVRSFGRGDQELFAICSQCVQRAGPDEQM